MMEDILTLTSLSTLLSLAIVFLTAYRISWKPKKTFPALTLLPGKEHGIHLYRALVDAYQKYRDVPYTVPAQPNHLVLPARYIPELKSLPDNVMSFSDEVMMRNVGEYTSIGILSSSLVNSVKVDLTRGIGKALEELQNESAFAFSNSLGPCDEWTEIPVYAKTLRIVSVLSARVFVGYPLCRNEEWIEAMINYTIDAFGVSNALLKIPSFIRPLVAFFLPEWQQFKAHRATGSRLLTPIIEERLAAMKTDPNYVLPNDAITFLIRNSGPGPYDGGEIVLLQLLLSLAAIHTTSMTFTHLIYDLCNHPELLQPLRDELESVLADNDGILVKSSMPKLRKMDSFIKESQRFNPLGCLSMERLVKKTHRFSDGLEIPKGTSVAVNSIGPSMDPAIYPDPEKFDGFRFSRLREAAGEETKHQFVTTGVHSLNFGHGLHACPGRFFASNELKVAFARVLREYDIRFREGEGRPANVFDGGAIVPDPSAVVMFKKRA